MLTKRADTIKSWMMLKGISRKKLAELSGLSERTISRMNRADYSGLARNYIKVADALGISFVELLEGPGGAADNV